MASIITIAGEKLFAAKAQANEQLDIDTFIFANVPGQDPTAPIDREEGIPTANLVHQQIVQQVGRINENVVVYSTVLDSVTGPFEFNWVGLYSSVNDTLVAINHIPSTSKTITEPGVAGNTLNRNFGIEYSGIADLTGITVAPETWQLDFTARLSGMDELTRQLAADMNGKDWFIGDGFKVVPRATANTFSVTPGVGYVSGLRIELAQEHILTLQTYPQFVYVDAWFNGTANSMWKPQVAFTVSNTEMDDYIDVQGVQHYVYKLAVLNSDSDVTDKRRKNSQIKTNVLSDVFGNAPIELYPGLVITPNNDQYPKLSAFDAIYELADNDVIYTVKSYALSVDGDCIITLDNEQNLIAKKVGAASQHWAETNFSRTFNTVEEMKLFNADEGMTVQTRGYYSAGDGGGAAYNVVRGVSADNWMTHDMNDGLVAVPQCVGLTSLLVAGGKADGDPIMNVGTDNSDAIQSLVNFCAEYGGTPYVPAGNYRKTKVIIWKASNLSVFRMNGWGMQLVGDGKFVSLIFGDGENGIDTAETGGLFEARDISIAGKGSMGTNPETGFSNVPTGIGIVNKHSNQELRTTQLKLTRVGVNRYERVSEGSRGNWLCYYHDCDFSFCRFGPDMDGSYGSTVTNCNFICRTVIECTDTYLVRTAFKYNHVALGTWSEIFGESEHTVNANIGQMEYIGNYHETYSRMAPGSIVLDLKYNDKAVMDCSYNYFSIGETSYNNLKAFRRIDGFHGIVDIHTEVEFKKNTYAVDPNIQFYKKCFDTDLTTNYKVRLKSDDINYLERGVKGTKYITALNSQVFKALITLNLGAGATLSMLDFLNDTNKTLLDGRVIDDSGKLLLNSVGRYKLSFCNVRNETLPAGKQVYIKIESVISKARLLLADDDVYSQKNNYCILNASFMTDASISLEFVGAVDYEKSLDIYVEFERIQ